jgi:hypothetical protein
MERKIVTKEKTINVKAERQKYMIYCKINIFYCPARLKRLKHKIGLG